jgi:hypothetical protein
VWQWRLLNSSAPNWNGGANVVEDLVNFFEGLFGGGGSSQPAFIPPGRRRIAHYPAIYFITDSEAQIEEYTPDQKESSASIEYIAMVGLTILTVVLAPELDLAVAAVEEDGETYEEISSGMSLAHQLTSEEQMGQALSGEGTPIAGAGTDTTLREADRLAQQ